MIHLSEKEKELIRLKSAGLTLQEIAKTLATNREYISQRLNDLYKKTGARNGPHLVSWAYENKCL